jgi:hypothetical protein
LKFGEARMSNNNNPELQRAEKTVTAAEAAVS